MSRGRPTHDPSLRNLKLYHELVCEGASQNKIAARLGISQPRIARICRQINAWLDIVLPLPLAARIPPTPGLAPAAQRFHLAVAFRHQHLAIAYKEFLDHLGGADGAIAYEQLHLAHDAGQLPADLAATLPPKDLIQSAARFARHLTDLASISALRPLNIFPNSNTQNGPNL
jgi:hypothetical protein